MEDKNAKYIWESDSAIDVKLLGLDTRLHVAVDFGASFIISGILAVIFRTVTAPVERVKLILQTQASSHQIGHAKRSAYSGILNALVRIPKEQGFASLWRGNLLNICRYFPAQAINFSFYNLYYEMFQKVRPTGYQRDYPFFNASFSQIYARKHRTVLRRCLDRRRVPLTSLRHSCPAVPSAAPPAQSFTPYISAILE